MTSHNPVRREDKPLVSNIAQKRLPDVIAEQIVEGIRREGLKPGDRLPPEQELARQLGVGRTSVREGLQKLQTLGIVDVHKGRGAFVSEPTEDGATQAFARWTSDHAFAIEELIEVRMALEAQAAGLAAVRADLDQVSEIEKRCREDVAVDPTNLALMVASDERFHKAIFQASGNQLLAALYDQLVPEVLEFRRKTLALPHAPRRSVAGHISIAKAIRQHDPTAARRVMIDHLWVLYEEVHTMAAHQVPGTASQFAPREAIDGGQHSVTPQRRRRSG